MEYNNIYDIEKLQTRKRVLSQKFKIENRKIFILNKNKK